MDSEKSKSFNEIAELIKDIDISVLNHSIIQDNKIIFPYNDKVYRCRMPNQREETNAEGIKNKLKIQLIQQEDTITKKELIKVLKEKQNIDIKELSKECNKLKDDLFQIYLKLAPIPTDKVDEINDLKDEINTIEEKFLKVTYEIAENLTPCIEEQIKVAYYRYLSYACSEVQVKEEEFKPIWETFDAFEKDDTGLSYKCIDCLHKLLLHIKE